VILAIDPGNTESAYVLWRDGKPVAHATLPNDELLANLYRWKLDRLECVIEMIGHYGTGMPAGKDVFDTCVWIGRFIEAFGEERCSRILRPTVKAHICGSAKAKDPNVRQAIIDKFGGKEAAIGKKATPGPLYGVSGDAWAALAVAMTWAERQR
jgi:hypothetical protein